MPAPSNLARFQRCESVTLHLEGGSVNNPKDPGGATKMGVMLPALELHRGHSCTWQDVKALTPGEVSAIYAETYWPAVHGDNLPAGVDLIVFDAAVNCGRGRAATFLQVGLGVTPDGAIGPTTLKAVAAASALAWWNASALRTSATTARSTFPTFGRGWLNRLATSR